MAQDGAASSRPTATAPGDRPRRRNEDPVAWAIETGRIAKESAQYWRNQVAASAEAATHVLELLHPGTAVPLTSAGRRVAAAGDEDEPDELYDRVFGDSDREKAERHLEWLSSIAEGNAIKAPLTQREARAELERLAQGDQVTAAAPGGGMTQRRVRVPAEAARKVLQRLDRSVDARWAR